MLKVDVFMVIINASYRKSIIHAPLTTEEVLPRIRDEVGAGVVCVPPAVTQESAEILQYFPNDLFMMAALKLPTESATVHLKGGEKMSIVRTLPVADWK